MLRKIDSRIKRKNQYESNSNQPDQGFYLTLITNWNQTSNRHVNTTEKKTSFQSTIFFNKRLPTHFIHNTLIINKYYFIVSSVIYNSRSNIRCLNHIVYIQVPFISLPKPKRIQFRGWNGGRSLSKKWRPSVRIHRFYRSRLDEQFFNSIKRSTSHAPLKRRRCAEEKVFFSAREREGKQRSRCALLYIQYRGMRIFAFISMFLNYSWKSNQLFALSRISIQSRQQRLFTFSVVMKGRREWGEVSCEKSDGWPRDAVSHISWNILAILGRKEDFTMTLMGL